MTGRKAVGSACLDIVSRITDLYSMGGETIGAGLVGRGHNVWPARHHLRALRVVTDCPANLWPARFRPLLTCTPMSDRSLLGFRFRGVALVWCGHTACMVHCPSLSFPSLCGTHPSMVCCTQPTVTGRSHRRGGHDYNSYNRGYEQSGGYGQSRGGGGGRDGRR